jgi:hypothetical protein
VRDTPAAAAVFSRAEPTQLPTPDAPPRPPHHHHGESFSCREDGKPPFRSKGGFPQGTERHRNTATRLKAGNKRQGQQGTETTETETETRGGKNEQDYFMLRNSASVPDIGLPGGISAGTSQIRPSGRPLPLAGRRADFEVFPIRIRLKTRPEARFPDRKHHCVP